MSLIASVYGQFQLPWKSWGLKTILNTAGLNEDFIQVYSVHYIHIYAIHFIHIYATHFIHIYAIHFIHIYMLFISFIYIPVNLLLQLNVLYIYIRRRGSNSYQAAMPASSKTHVSPSLTLSRWYGVGGSSIFWYP